MPKYTSEEQRIAALWDKIKLPDQIGTSECWEWNAGTNKKGYGSVWFRGRVELAHRAIYILTIGDIPDGLLALHSCDNPPCCNPDHLWLGTNDDNMKDMVAKGRSAKHAGVDNGRAKLDEGDVMDIRRSKGMSTLELAHKYNVSRSLIGQIRLGTVWKHLPLP